MERGPKTPEKQPREPGDLSEGERTNLLKLLAVLGVVGWGGYATYEKNPEYFSGTYSAPTSAPEKLTLPSENTELREAIAQLIPEALVTRDEEIFTTDPASSSISPDNGAEHSAAYEESFQSDASTEIVPDGDLTAEPEKPVRPQLRPEYLEQFDTSVYESLPEHSEKLLSEIITAQVFITMPDGVMVTDEKGRVIATIAVDYISNINPGAGFSETGHVSGGYDSKWKEAAVEVAARELHTTTSELTLEYNWKEIDSGYKKIGEYPKSMLDVAFHFAQEPVTDTGLSRAQYLQNNLEITNERMSTALKNELAFVAIGIPGEETRFDENVVSPVKATTTFQFMEETWNDDRMGYPSLDTFPGRMPPYELQVEAFGKYLGLIYNELHQSAEDVERLAQLRELFDSDEAYYRYLLVPLIVNSYNAGAGTMRAAVKHFLITKEYALLKKQAHNGYDVFASLSDTALESQDGPLASYKKWSHAYVRSAMAFAAELNKVYPPNQPYEVASSE